VRSALGPLAQESEIFFVETGLFGVSVPTAVVEAVGEQVVFRQLAPIGYYDLWSGRWHTAEAR